MSLTSYRAAPPRGIILQQKGPLSRPFCVGLGRIVIEKILVALCRPGSDLLSRVLRRSTMGAGAFHGRVRKGNGCSHPAITTRSAKRNFLFEKLDLGLSE